MRCGIQGCCGRATRTKGVEADGVDDTLSLDGRPGRETGGKDESRFSHYSGKWEVDSCGNTMRSILVGCGDTHMGLVTQRLPCQGSHLRDGGCQDLI